MKKRLRNAGCLLLGIVMLLGLTGCNWAGLDNDIQEIKGSIKGCTYNCMFYSNTGTFYDGSGRKYQLVLKCGKGTLIQ